MEERRLKFIRHYDQKLSAYLEQESNPKIRIQLEKLFYERATKELEEESQLAELDKKLRGKDMFILGLIKNKARSDMDIHNPKETVSFLSSLTMNNPLKYLTHTWDNSPFNYEKFMISVSNDLINLIQKHPNVPYPILYKIKNYTLNKSPNWGSNNIKIGFRSREVVAFAMKEQKHPCEMELPGEGIRLMDKSYLSDFWDVMNKFRREIRFAAENPDLYTWLDRKKQEFKINEHNVKLSENLRGRDFFIDVDQFKHGLKKLFDGIAKRSKTSAVKIDLQDSSEEYYELSIIHCGQKVMHNKGPYSPKIRPSSISGDFLEAKEKFRGCCDWSMEAGFRDGKTYRVNYLDSYGKEEIEEIGAIEGITHRIKLFKA